MTDGREPGSAQDGQAAPADAPDRARTFPCDSCGADVEFDPGVQRLRCPYCGADQDLEDDPERAVEERDYDAAIARLAELRDRGRRDEEGFREIDCAACGATARFVGTLTADACAYCGAPIQIEGAHAAAHRVPVDGVLPFRIERASARERLRTWVRGLWFAPTEFTKRGIRERFRGVYLPYWTFDAQTHNAWTGMRGEHYWVTVGSGKSKRRVRKTRWYPVSGRFRMLFDDVLVTASAGLPTRRLRALEPWPLTECRPFDPGLLAGFQSRTYDVELPDGFRLARERMSDALRGEVRRRIGGDEQRILGLETAYEGVTFKHLLLPVWILAYRFKDRTYRVLVNAVTGEVQGDRPWSWVKIALAAIGVAAVIGLVALVRSLTG